MYRGTAVPELTGHYIYSDYCKGWIRSFHFADGEVSEQREWMMPRAGSISSFGQGGRGEVYVVAIEGEIFEIVAQQE